MKLKKPFFRVALYDRHEKSYLILDYQDISCLVVLPDTNPPTVQIYLNDSKTFTITMTEKEILETLGWLD